MIVSVGQLHSSARLLDLVASSSLAPAALRSTNEILLVCPVTDVLNLSMRCGWLELDSDGNLRCSKRGEMIRVLSDFQQRLRHQLWDFIATLQPAWSKKIMHGRREVLRFVHPDICQCFNEAGLMSIDITNEVVRWWDELANLARGVRSAASTTVGRTGERLTLAYERSRTGQNPIWQSIESAFSGYDVLSVVSTTDLTPMQIEVKASELRVRDAEVHLTANEWRSAQQARAYVFHLWQIGTPQQLAIVPIAKMGCHVPTNNGDGAWESLKVPYRAFSSLFVPVETLVRT